MGTRSLPGVKSGRNVRLTPHPLLVPWSRKGRAIPLLPLWAVRPVQSLSACTRVHFTLVTVSGVSPECAYGIVRDSSFEITITRICLPLQINHQPDANIFQFIILTFVYSSTCFGGFPTHHQELNDCSGSLWFYLRIVVTVVLCSWSGRL